MKKSIGMESRVLVRDAKRAVPPQEGSGAGASGFAALAAVAAMIFFWLGQMMSQTLRNMKVPRPAPTMMELKGAEPT